MTPAELEVLAGIQRQVDAIAEEQALEDSPLWGTSPPPSPEPRELSGGEDQAEPSAPQSSDPEEPSLPRASGGTHGSPSKRRKLCAFDDPEDFGPFGSESESDRT